MEKQFIVSSKEKVEQSMIFRAIYPAVHMEIQIMETEVCGDTSSLLPTFK